MKPDLIRGVSREETFEVTEAMCPAFDGQVVHRVCATWTLVHYMELAGRRVLVDFLEPDEEGVGSHVTCDHLASVPIGMTVRVVATATEVSERELVCDVTAHSDDRQIASGRTVQRVYQKKVLARILNHSSGSSS
ncbi:MAG: thioesterase family protein [Phycisphaerae bacterium]